MYFFWLIRWPNLLIIALTMFLVRYYLMLPYFEAAGLTLLPSGIYFGLLIFSVLFIAAGGNVINDIFDVDTDMINKPDKSIIGKEISLESGRKIYAVLTFSGLFMSFFLAFLVESIHFALVFIFMAGLMWFYARRYKQQLIIGNLVVAFASAMVLIVVWLFDFFYLSNDVIMLSKASVVMGTVMRYVFAYTIFAFAASFIRELVKDMQDVKGDERIGCRTFPVVFGLTYSRNLALALLFILIVLIGFWQYFLLQIGSLAAFGFLFLADGLAMMVMARLYYATETSHYAQASLITKGLMLAGILSIPMIFLQ